MSVDIYGCVEVCTSSGLWAGVIDINAVLAHDTRLYGCLFGATYGALGAAGVEFNAMLPVRGVSPSPSDAFCDCAKQQLHHDLDCGPPAPIHRATWVTHAELRDALAHLDEPAVRFIPSPSSFEPVLVGRTRRDCVMTPTFELLFQLSCVLAEFHGDANVRWSVFFA